MKRLLLAALLLCACAPQPTLRADLAAIMKAAVLTEPCPEVPDQKPEYKIGTACAMFHGSPQSLLDHLEANGGEDFKYGDGWHQFGNGAHGIVFLVFTTKPGGQAYMATYFQESGQVTVTDAGS